MDWLSDWFGAASVAHAVFVLMVVGALGLGLGAIRVRGVSLGVGGVLFSGLICGHLGAQISPEIMDFAREFGLILFVYTIGLQVGPGFFGSLRRDGLALNAMAAALVLLGVGATVLVARLGDVPASVAVGIFSGATTNTPSLAAAQQALQSLGDLPELVVQQPAMGYAIAYPFGIVGTLFAMLLVRWVFRVNAAREVADLVREAEHAHPPLATRNIEVTNPNLGGVSIARIPGVGEFGVVIARVLQRGVAKSARGDLRLGLGDVLLAVGSVEGLDRFQMVVGRDSEVDVEQVPSSITSRWIVVTREAPLGKTIHDLDINRRYGVTVSRIARSEVEFAPTRGLRLQFGDRVRCVGEGAALDAVTRELGNSVKRLERAQIVPVFVGIALGILAGSIPLHITGIPAPVRLGLAGGPLIVAILLARVGHVGRLVWYMPASANLVLREVGIALFLAVVGLRAGSSFVTTLVEGEGWTWMAWGALVTFVPVILIAVVARLFRKLNYATLCGLLAGSMTQPPALAFATSSLESEAPSVSYATVYPLVMLLRVVAAQILVLAIL